MSVQEFIYVNNLEVGDVIVARKNGFLGILDHYIVFLGWNRYGSRFEFIANFTEGVKTLSKNEMDALTQSYTPTRIKKFVGSIDERNSAVNRAMIKLRFKEAYNLFTKNCEHFANYVQTGKEYSAQTKIAGTAMVGGGILMAAKSKNENTKLIGGGIAALGAFLLYLENLKE